MITWKTLKKYNDTIHYIDGFFFFDTFIYEYHKHKDVNVKVEKEKILTTLNKSCLEILAMSDEKLSYRIILKMFKDDFILPKKVSFNFYNYFEGKDEGLKLNYCMFVGAKPKSKSFTRSYYLNRIYKFSKKNKFFKTEAIDFVMKLLKRDCKRFLRYNGIDDEIIKQLIDKNK